MGPRTTGSGTTAARSTMGDLRGGSGRGWFRASGAPEERARPGRAGRPAMAGTAGDRRRSMGTLPMPGSALSGAGLPKDPELKLKLRVHFAAHVKGGANQLEIRAW